MMSVMTTKRLTLARSKQSRSSTYDIDLVEIVTPNASSFCFEVGGHTWDISMEQAQDLRNYIGDMLAGREPKKPERMTKWHHLKELFK